MSATISDGPFDYNEGEILYRITGSDGRPDGWLCIGHAQPAFFASTLVAAANVGIAHIGEQLTDRAIGQILDGEIPDGETPT